MASASSAASAASAASLEGRRDKSRLLLESNSRSRASHMPHHRDRFLDRSCRALVSSDDAAVCSQAHGRQQNVAAIVRGQGRTRDGDAGLAGEAGERCCTQLTG